MKSKIITIIIGILLILPLTLSQGNITNLLLNQPLPDFIAGETTATSFTFNYPHKSSTYPNQEDNALLVLIINLSSNDPNYPVWNGDFKLNGSINGETFECFENDFIIDFICNPNETILLPNGTFYCIKDNFLTLSLGSQNNVELSLKSHPALYPGSYNLSISLFYPEINHTKLITTPLNPDGKNGWFVTEPIFTLENSEALSLYYQWDSATIFNYIAPFSLENIINPSNTSAGTLELNYWADLDCGLEKKNTRIIYVDLTNPIISELTPFDGEVIYNNFRPKISAYLDEVYQSNSGIKGVSVVMKVDGQDVGETVENLGSLDARVSYIPPSNLNQGSHEVYVYVEDNAGRNNSLNWTFEINDSTPFYFDINSPSEPIYNSKKILINISSLQRFQKIEYINWNDKKPRWKRLCKNCNDYGALKKRKKNFNEGENNISIRAEDKFGQVVEKNINFFIDSKKPKISRVLPRRNSFINGSEFYIKYTETNLKKVELFWNNSKILNDCNTSGKNQECTININLSNHNGYWIEYWFEVSDNINTAKSRKTRVRVDTIPPKLLNPNSFYNQTNKYIYFNLSIEENNLKKVEYIDSNTQKPRWRKLCSRLKNNICYKKKSFKPGPHNLSIRAIDKAGNSITKQINFEV
jgi:hypothetical protein